MILGKIATSKTIKHNYSIHSYTKLNSKFIKELNIIYKSIKYI